jgi:hypothetical protein
MRIRPIAAAGVGMTAAVAFTAAASPAFAASSSLLDGSGNQGAGIVGVFDNQAAPQLAGGQIIQGQGNLNPDGRALTRGDIDSVMQKNKAGGDAGNDGWASQSINHGGVGDSSLLGVVGNQLVVLWPWATGIYDNQATGQGAVGQGGFVQGNGNAFLRGLAPGDDGDVWQSNWAEGNGWNNGEADQSINHGGEDRSDLLGIVGNQGSGIASADDNQVAGQGAVGQAGVAQGNLNVPINVLSPGDDGPVNQTNDASGAASNSGSATQDIVH